MNSRVNLHFIIILSSEGLSCGKTFYRVFTQRRRWINADQMIFGRHIKSRQGGSFNDVAHAVDNLEDCLCLLQFIEDGLLLLTRGKIKIVCEMGRNVRASKIQRDRQRATSVN